MWMTKDAFSLCSLKAIISQNSKHMSPRPWRERLGHMFNRFPHANVNTERGCEEGKNSLIPSSQLVFYQIDTLFQQAWNREQRLDLVQVHVRLEHGWQAKGQKIRTESQQYFLPHQDFEYGQNLLIKAAFSDAESTEGMTRPSLQWNLVGNASFRRHTSPYFAKLNIGRPKNSCTQEDANNESG